MGNWFATPAALWSALLFGPLLLLYMLRHRPVKRRVPSIVLWTGVAQSQIATSPFQRLRRSLSLLLMLLALLALVLALAGFRVPGGESRGLPVVIVIDVTASMNAADAGGDRLKTARSRAEAVIDAAGNSPISMFAWDGNLRPLVPADSEPSLARRALARVEATHTGASDAALNRALEALADGSRRIALISDHPPGEVPGVYFVQAGAAALNVAIVSASLSEITASQVDLFFAIELFGSDAPLTVPVVLERMDRAEPDLVDARDVTVHPGRRSSVSFTGVRPGLYAARLKIDDALDLDNVAWLRFSELPLQDVVISADAPEPILRAAQAIESGMGMIRLREAGTEDAATATYVLTDAASSGAQPRMPSVYVAPDAAPPLAAYSPRQDNQDGITRPVSGFLWRGAGTPDIRLPIVYPLNSTRRAVPVLEAGQATAISLLARDDGLSDLVLGFPIDETAAGFTGRHAFVIFWANWFDHVRRSREALPRGSVSTRESTNIPAIATGTEIRVSGVGGTTTHQPGRPIHLDRIGVYRFEGLLDTSLGALGVSLLDAAESDTASVSPAGFDGDAMQTWMDGHEGSGESRDLSLRPWLALLACALLVFDWFWFRRKFPMQAEGRPVKPKTQTAIRAKHPRSGRARS